MFDEIKQSTPSDANPPVDIFSDTDKEGNRSAPPGVLPPLPKDMHLGEHDGHSFLSKKVLFIAGGCVLGVVIIGVLVQMFVFKGSGAQKEVAKPVIEQNQDAPTTATIPSVPAEQQPVEQVVAPVVEVTPIDADNDGLVDQEEVAVYHSDISNPDTDGDGLSDGDEVKQYHTDPLKSDSDGDGYVDGEEVKNGYNPLGPGKMAPVTEPTVEPATTLPPVLQ
ncbi:MAG: hypothetical protein Q7S47_01335 [bacterium]|nr:hypothetical protein [bacterium]